MMEFEIGQAIAILTESAKQAAARPSMSYGMVGELQLSKSGWLLLKVPNAIVRGAFAALHEPGAELPPSGPDDRLDAHISIMRPEEIATIKGGAAAITERGRDFSYTLGPVRSTVPAGWKEMSKVWMIEVRSPELKQLRKSYGLTPLPHDNEYQFHCTIAVRRKGVLATNNASKAASLIYDGDVQAFFKSPPNKEGRRCPSCGELFKEIEPYPDVENCETCERFGPPKKKEAAVSTKQMIATERRKVEEPASEEQAEAGNYRKGHIKLHGLDISIENAKGSTRSGTSPDGKKWKVEIVHDYGYIRTTEGPDGDSVDVFIGGSPDTELVFVVDQLDPATLQFDETKVMLGFQTQADAEEGYLANYEKGWKGMGTVTAATVSQFKEWLENGDTTKALAPYARKTWKAKSAGIRDLADDEAAVHQPPQSKVSVLRRAGDPGVRPMDEELLGFPSRHGSAARRDDIGSRGHGRGLHAGELPVGIVGCSTSQQTKQSVLHIPRPLADIAGLGKGAWYCPGDPATAPTHLRVDSGAGIHAAVKPDYPADESVDHIPRRDKDAQAMGERDRHQLSDVEEPPQQAGLGCGASTDDARAKVQLAKQAALGIPDRADMGDLAKLPPGLADFVIQYHQARRAGPHYDVRFGTPETGLFSWATRHALPEPGSRRALFRQPLHSHDYGSFEGNLPVGGYGAGQVKIHRKGQVLVTKIKPGLVEFTTADKRHPERFKLLRPAGWKDDDWLLINTTPHKGVPYDKVHYKKVDGTQVDSAIDKMQQGDSIEAKIDGASSLVKLLEKGVEITSYRTSKEGRPLVHTERVLHGRPEMDIPKELVGTVLKGELYGQGAKGVIPAQELGGLLNAALAKSIGQQRERGIQLRNMVYDVQQLGKQPVDVNQVPRSERRKMMEEVIKHLPAEVFGVSEAVEDPEKARQLWSQIQAGEHPLTSEGVVGHPAVGRPWKGKITEESDVHVTGVFPGEGRLAGEGAGGFEYALEPGGPTVGKVGTGVSDEVRKALWADPEAYIGRVAKIRAQEQFPSGAHRAPVFRSWHEDYPLATKEGEVCQGPYCSVDDLRRFLPEADLSLDGGIQKQADKDEHPPIIAVDLDGTILEYKGWKGEDHFGDPRPGARKALKELQRRGYLVVVHTCRGNTQAVKDVLHSHDLPYDYVNFSPYQPPGTSDKIQADIYIDDRAVNARQPWSKITKETLRRIEAANKKNGNGKTKAADQGSFYLAAVPGTQVTYDPNESAVQNLVRNLGHVRQRGDQAIREAYTQDALANAADPNRSIRRFSSYLAGTRKPIVHHWLDRIIQG